MKLYALALTVLFSTPLCAQDALRNLPGVHVVVWGMNTADSMRVAERETRRIRIAGIMDGAPELVLSANVLPDGEFQVFAQVREWVSADRGTFVATTWHTVLGGRGATGVASLLHAIDQAVDQFLEAYREANSGAGNRVSLVPDADRQSNDPSVRVLAVPPLYRL